MFRLLPTKTFRGLALVELIVAMGIFTVALTTMISVTLYARSFVSDRRNTLFATNYAQEGITALRLLRDQNWTNIPDGTYGLLKSGSNWQLSNNADIRNGFTRIVTIRSDSANRKTISSTVSWQPAPGRTPSIRLLSLLTNWKSTQQSNFLSGDWTHPFVAGSGDIESGAAGTDVIADGNYAYLSSKHADVSKIDFSSFDISTPTSPKLLSSQDVGTNNISALAKSGNYVYGSIANSTDEIIILDVTNPASPVNVKMFPIPNSNGVAQSIAVSGTTLYVGMQQISGEPELFALDVSNPTNPKVIGSFEVNGTVNAITIFNNKAYLATSVDTAELMVVDITDPTHMKLLGSYDAPGTVDGTNVYVKDEYDVYLGRALASTTPEFNIINAGNPAAITLVGSYDLGATINDMVVVNHLAFLATDYSNGELQILDIGNPQSIKPYSSLNVSQVATGVSFSNNTVYISMRSNNALDLVRSQ